MTDKNGNPAPHGLDGFGRAAGRPLSAAESRGVGLAGVAILLAPALAAIVVAVSGI